eukprot:TRINITY_DN11879_c0_g1_i2.p1 TRINITY_DN11879_c0_g1~~TRINITY_DN11879_c0_g1_i2.p1  ORF type:complete len:1797 (+),score=636.32 TRINITY_DN11879_c0_g1_i2:847-6237(+)
MHLTICGDRFGQATVRVLLKDSGQCDNQDDRFNACVPKTCCESNPVEFQVTVQPVNDCPSFRFRGVDVNVDNSVNAWLDTQGGSGCCTGAAADIGGPCCAASSGGTVYGTNWLKGIDGGRILSWEDSEVCQIVFVGVHHGGWNEGPAELAAQQNCCQGNACTGTASGAGASTGACNEPWDDQELIWTVSNDNNDLFKTQPYVRYVQGFSCCAELCYVPAQDRIGEALVRVHLEDTGGQVGNTIPAGTPINPLCPKSTGVLGCFVRGPEDEVIKVIVREINDPPTFVAGPQEVVVLEDSGQYKQLWATDIRAGPDDEIANGQLLAYFNVTLKDSQHENLFTEQPSIDLNGILTFTPAKHVHTEGFVVEATVRLLDLVPAVGGFNEPLTPAWSALERTVRIVIDPVNDAPFYRPPSPRDVEVFEDQVNITLPWARNACAGWDPDWEACIANEGPGNWSVGTNSYHAEHQLVQFTTVPANPGLFTWKPSINENGTLFFSLEPDENGESEVTVTQIDDGGVTPGQNTGPIERFVIHVTPVNDPPVFEQLLTSITVDEDADPQDIARIVYNIRPGPSDELNQSVSLVSFVDHRDLFSSLPEFVLNAQQSEARLLFSVAPDFFGKSTISFHVDDNGGTLHGGDDRREGQAIVITINNVNDPPAVVLGASVVQLEDQYLSGYRQAGWIVSATAGPREDSVQTLNYTTVCTGAAGLFKSEPAVTPRGALLYTPNPDAFGGVTCGVIVADVDVATGQTLSELPPQYFSIALQPVNDPPDFNAAGDVVVEECAVAAGCQHVIKQWATNLSAGPANEVYQRLSFSTKSPLRDVSSVFLVWPTVQRATGDLSFTLAPDKFLEPGETMHTTLQDDGGTDNGGVDSRTRTWTLRVTSRVEVAPSGPARPVRLTVVQQPAVHAGRVTPAVFRLVDGDGRAAPAASTWRIGLVPFPGDGKWLSTPTSFVSQSPVDLREFDKLLDSGVGVFYALAEVTLDDGEVLTAATGQFTVAEAAGALTAQASGATVGSSFDEAEIRKGKGHFDIRIVGGAGAWSSAAYSSSVQTEEGVPLSADVSVLPDGVLRMSIVPQAGFGIDRDTVAVVSVPAGAVGSGSKAATFRFPISAAPTLLLAVAVRTAAVQQAGQDLQVTSSQVQNDGVSVTLSSTGADWSAQKAAAALRNAARPTGQLASRWSALVDASAEAGGRVAVLRVGPDQGYAAGAADVLGFDLQALGAGLAQEREPEWASGSPRRVVVSPPAAAAAPEGVSSSAKALGDLTAALGWLCVLSSAAAAPGPGTLAAPPACFTYLLLATVPCGPQPRLHMHHRLEPMLELLGELGGSPAAGAAVLLTVISAGFALLHRGVVQLLMLHMRGDQHTAAGGGVSSSSVLAKAKARLRFPSASVAVAALLTPLAVYGAITAAAWGGDEDPVYDPDLKPLGPSSSTPSGTKVVAVIAAVLLLVGVVASVVYMLWRLPDLVWFEAAKKPGCCSSVGRWEDVPGGHGTMRYAAAFGTWRGRFACVAMCVADVVSLSLLPGLLAGVDPRGGDDGMCRVAGMAAVCVLSVRLAAVVALRARLSPLLQWLDAAATAAAALSAIFTVLWASEDDTDLARYPPGASRWHWASTVSAAAALIAAALCIAISVIHTLGWVRQACAGLCRRPARSPPDSPVPLGVPRLLPYEVTLQRTGPSEPIGMELEGTTVVAVTPGSEAARSGIREGMSIAKVSGEAVTRSTAGRAVDSAGRSFTIQFDPASLPSSPARARQSNPIDSAFAAAPSSGSLERLRLSASGHSVGSRGLSTKGSVTAIRER